MFKLIIGRWLKPNSRNSIRFPASQNAQCFLSSYKNSQQVSVYASDISSSGMSFVFRNAWFEINDSMKVLLVKNERQVEVEGQIVSQKILYPQGSLDLKNAVYRYSIKFLKPVATDDVSYFSESTDAC